MKLPIGKSSILAILAMLAIPTFAQGPEPGQKDYTATSVSFQLVNPPAAVPLANIGVQRLDNPGSCSYYYWVVAKFLIGNATPAGPVGISNGACTLVNGIQVSWSSVSQATGYDLLRTTTFAPPVGACNCAVATGLTTAIATDTGTLGAYTVNTFDPNSVTCRFDNEATGPGAASVQLRCSNLPPASIGSVQWNNILNPTADQLLSMGTFKSTWQGNGNAWPMFYFDPVNGFGISTATVTAPATSFSTTPPWGFEIRGGNTGTGGPSGVVTKDAVFTLRTTNGNGEPQIWFANASGNTDNTFNAAHFQFHQRSSASDNSLRISPFNGATAGYESIWMPDGRFCLNPSFGCPFSNFVAFFAGDSGNNRPALNLDANGARAALQTTGTSFLSRTATSTVNPGTIANSYLHLGGNEAALANSFRAITFGWQNNTTNAPCYAGYKETDTANSRAGDLGFGCRTVNTDSAPSESFRVDHATNKLVANVGVDAKRFGCNLSATHYSGADPAIVLSAGWGGTAVVQAANGCDQALSFGVLSNGAGIAANPTITITFKDGAFPANFPISVCKRNDISSPAESTAFTTWIDSVTTNTITFNGTPVAGVQYNFFCLTGGT